MKLTNRVAIVTGAGRGMGKAIAATLARAGATVAVCDVDAETAGLTAAEIADEGGQAMAFQVDVADRAEVKCLVENVVKSFKGVHILVNNAGIIRNALLVDMSEEDWDSVMNVDLKGVFNCTQAVSGLMLRQRYGKIVNISSICGLGATNGELAAYAAAKAGVIQLTKVAARELGPWGINVNTVAPGAIMTDMTRSGRTEAETQRFIEEKTSQSCLRRVGLPEDVANAVLFLVADESSFITGQILRVDGGRSDLL